MEGPFDKIDGVVSTTSGYTAGHTSNPNYQQVVRGNTGHTEAVQIVYDPNKVTFEKLLDVYWVNIDPLVKNRQFCDRGPQYRAGVFYHDDQQKDLALASRKAVQERFNEPVVTEITRFDKFYRAEEYHQDYYLKNPIRYKYYRLRCGRDDRLEQLWGKQS